MPKNKDFKRLVRARMRKSGESYTAARRQLLRKNAAAPEDRASRVPAAEFAARAGMRDDAVSAKTGCTWRRWVRILDDAGASGWPHKDIARHLGDAHGLPPWWRQTVAVGYERIRGLREIGQQRVAGKAASYVAHKSRTFAVPRATLYRACRDAAIRAEWMPGSGLSLRKATPPRYLRWRGPGSEPVEMVFITKAPGKSTVQIQSGGLPSRAAVDAEKARWSTRLDALAKTLKT